MITQVVNLKHESYDVYIGRGSIFGNPFMIGYDGTRQEVIEQFREWAPRQKKIMDNIHLLKGNRLGCFCKPLPCHGDWYCEVLNG